MVYSQMVSITKNLTGQFLINKTGAAMKKHVLFCIIFCAVIVSAVITGCAQPSPLYGTWNDNQGNKISFMSDNTFTASVYDDLSHETIISSGRYNVLLNALTFSTDTGQTLNTEWDIRGNMLYLDWTLSDGTTKHLILYKTVSL